MTLSAPTLIFTSLPCKAAAFSGDRLADLIEPFATSSMNRNCALLSAGIDCLLRYLGP